jgi:energy-coupling factor transporter ATP-binding protein EcfA2
MNADLFAQITQLFAQHMQDERDRAALVKKALHDCRVLTQITWTGAAATFAPHLVSTLDAFGACAGRDLALIRVLQALRAQLGTNWDAQIDPLIAALRAPDPASDAAPPDPLPDIPLILTDAQQKRGVSPAKLFISYKRGSDGVERLIADLRAAKYTVWFDRDDIHVGDADWLAKIKAGIWSCAGLVLCLTNAAVASRPVQIEVLLARSLGKPIFPVLLEPIPDLEAALVRVGLERRAHVEPFTRVSEWDAAFKRLKTGVWNAHIRPTRHTEREQVDRDNPKYMLHQRYLRALVERVGTVNLAQIAPEQVSGVPLERVYIDSPLDYALSVEVQDWRIVEWWIDRPSQRRMERAENSVRTEPEGFGWERAPLETLIDRLQQQIDQYRADHPDLKPDDEPWENYWNNGDHEDVLALHLQHIASACPRLVVLGKPGSGKSTFARHLALCLAGAGIDASGRAVGLDDLDGWTHGKLTPIYIELRRFISSTHFPTDIKADPTTTHLWAYIKNDLLGAELAGYADDLLADLQEGKSLLILDGLDEVPYPTGKLKARQRQLVALAQSIDAGYRGARVLVASRPYAYTGWTLPGYQAVEIADFEDAHRGGLAAKLYRAAGLSDQDADTKARALVRELDAKRVHPELKDRPLFVTLMAAVYLSGADTGLPTRRGALYRRSILLLLDRWTTSKPNAPSLTEILGDKTVGDLLKRLAALAYDVHTERGHQRGTPEIDVGDLFKHLRKLGGGVAEDLIQYLSENAGVLVSPGQDEERDVFHFAHRSFQEYLAGCQLVTRARQADSFAEIGTLIEAKPDIWREPCQFAADALMDSDDEDAPPERRADLWRLIGDLLEPDMPTQANSPVWWRAWLAGEIAAAHGLRQQTKLNKYTELPVRNALVDWLNRLLERGALPPVERALCGRVLGNGLIDGKWADRRAGVGLRADGLPDIVWSDVIESGDFIMGSDKDSDNPKRTERIEQPYRIAKYPVTYIQFQAFVDAPDGWHNPDWWRGLDMPDGHNAAPGDQAFKFWNHPREGVSWYDAVAFCRWLSAKRGEEIRLPTEQEWERAARGTDGREYPYSGTFDAAKGNTRETGIGQTSAVGIFPDGESPVGALDMSGNVWEWCLNKYGEPSNVSLSGTNIRVLRGGSWNFNQDLARAASRYSDLPHERNYFSGFRVCCCPY